jgi:hypothetical protein
MGQPQLGQAGALSENCFPHSEHVINAITISSFRTRIKYKKLQTIFA